MVRIIVLVQHELAKPAPLPPPAVEAVGDLEAIRPLEP